MGPESNIGSPSSVRPSWWRNTLWIATVALIYFATARLSLLLLFQPEGIAAIWPPSGIFLAAILLTRRDLRPWLAGALRPAQQCPGSAGGGGGIRASSRNPFVLELVGLVGILRWRRQSSGDAFHSRLGLLGQKRADGLG